MLYLTDLPLTEKSIINISFSSLTWDILYQEKNISWFSTNYPFESSFSKVSYFLRLMEHSQFKGFAQMHTF